MYLMAAMYVLIQLPMPEEARRAGKKCSERVRKRVIRSHITPIGVNAHKSS